MSAVPWWREIIYHHVQAKSECKKILGEYSGLQYLGGGQSSFTMLGLNLNVKNFRWVSGLQYLSWVQSSFTMCRLNLYLKILDEYSGLQYLR